MRHAQTLIVGGGPAGSAAGTLLARAGRQVLLIERGTDPAGIVCGGFLGGDALAALARLGLDVHSLGAAPIDRLRLAYGARQAEARLPFAAAGLTRATLDPALRAMAAAAGVEVRSGTAVREVDVAARRVRVATGETLSADRLLIATGKHPVRGLNRHRRREAQGAVGLRIGYLPDPATREALSGVIELHPFNQGYVGLLLAEGGMVNLCLSVTPARLRAAGDPDRLLAEIIRESPLLGRRVDRLGGQRWCSIAAVPYGWRARASWPGVYRLGDQAAVISSLAGDGVAIALRSGERAAQAILVDQDGPVFQTRFADEAARPIRVAGALRYAAERPALRTWLFRGMASGDRLAALAARFTRIG